MKTANLISLYNAHNSLDRDTFCSYLEYYSINIKCDEINDLKSLVDELHATNVNANVFDNFYVGYVIPQIGKEFDLLRIDDSVVVNIELKCQSTTDKIQKQLSRNKYYLSFLGRVTYSYAYISSMHKVFALDGNDHVIEIEFSEFINVLNSQNSKYYADLNTLFIPTNYLVSPFNSTGRFIAGEYFLTKHQEEIKKSIFRNFGGTAYAILAIKGRAGTGKTLLTYDIVKDARKNRKVLIVHCGNLNNGHNELRSRYGWSVIPIKSLRIHDLSKYDLIVVDEAQRMYPNQLDNIISITKSNSTKCIFSYDGVQTLASFEKRNDIEKKIEMNVTSSTFELTTKIRTNKDAATFIKCLLDEKHPIEKIQQQNIKIQFFTDMCEAKRYLEYLSKSDWKVINYTPSRYHTPPYERYKLEEELDNAHTVIGQEFDNVVAVVDEYFYYEKGLLQTRNYRDKPYYHPTKMLFQILSRTRVGLMIVIINNQCILKRCLEVLRHDKANVFK